MRLPLRKLFPSVAVGPAGPAAAMGVDWAPGVRLPCPVTECTTAADPPAIPTARDPDGGWWAGPCPRCGWAGTVFEAYLEATGLTPAAGLRAVRRAGYRAPRKCSSPAVLAAWEAHRRATSTLRALQTRMRSRRLAGPVHGHALAVLGLTTTPHHDPLWWCLTPGELDLSVGKSVAPTSAVFRRFGAITREQLETPTVVVPLYDGLRRLTGTVGFSTHVGVPSVYVRTRPHAVACGFLHTADVVVPRLGVQALLTSCPVTALTLVCSYLRDNPGPPPVVYIPPNFSVGGVTRTLPARPWVYVTTRGARPAEPGRPGLVAALLRRLGGRALAVPWDELTVQGIGRQADAAVSWARYLEAELDHAPSDAWRQEVLTDAGWDDAVAAAVRPQWKHATWARAVQAVTPTARVRTVNVAPGLTVIDTASGWVWEETGETLAAARPVDVRVVRGVGRLVYHGRVVYAGRVVAFRSARFRVDPGGVVAAALLHAGVVDPPPLHPRVAPHAAAVALHFSRGPSA